MAFHESKLPANDGLYVAQTDDMLDDYSKNNTDNTCRCTVSIDLRSSPRSTCKIIASYPSR